MVSIIADGCRRLQELALSVDSFDTRSNNAVGEMIIACRDTLRTLDIRSPFIAAERLPIVANLPQLWNLRLYSYFLRPSTKRLSKVIILHFHGQRFQHFPRTTGLKAIKYRASKLSLSSSRYRHFLGSQPRLESWRSRVSKA